MIVKFWRRFLTSCLCVLALPVFLCLMIGRLLFFGALRMAAAARQTALGIRDRPAPRQPQIMLLPFWAAWIMAVVLLAASFAGSIAVVAQTQEWSLQDQIITRGAVSGLALLAFYLAYHLALYGTAALQRALAHNLASLIAFELAELRSEAEARALVLTSARPSASPAFRLPNFYDEREDIVKLLGRPTEQALERLLHSLENFNNIAADDLDQHAEARLRHHLSAVYDCLNHAMRAIDPFCRRVV
nr:hypothetical protein [uncultured Dongia sp.]